MRRLASAAPARSRFSAESTHNREVVRLSFDDTPERCTRRVRCHVGAGWAIRGRELLAGRARRQSGENAGREGSEENCRRRRDFVVGLEDRSAPRTPVRHCTSSPAPPYPVPATISVEATRPLPSHHPTSSRRGFETRRGSPALRLVGCRDDNHSWGRTWCAGVGGPTVRRARSTGAAERDERRPGAWAGPWRSDRGADGRRGGEAMPWWSGRRPGRRTVWPCLPLRAGPRQRMRQRDGCVQGTTRRIAPYPDRTAAGERGDPAG